MHGMVGAWGAVWWAPGTSHLPPSAMAAGLCPRPSSNNLAEFYGFLACLCRAMRVFDSMHLVFELDSMLVVKLMRGEWGCHRAHLRILLQECHDVGEGLARRGCTWTVRHIYREYNTLADGLAGNAIQEGLERATGTWFPARNGAETSTNASGSESSGDDTALLE